MASIGQAAAHTAPAVVHTAPANPISAAAASIAAAVLAMNGPIIPASAVPICFNGLSIPPNALPNSFENPPAFCRVAVSMTSWLAVLSAPEPTERTPCASRPAPAAMP
jgi:hypothetical protein